MSEKEKFLADMLKDAKALIVSPANWGRGHAAISFGGEPCNPKSPIAHSFCSFGAVIRAQGYPRYSSIDTHKVGELMTSCLPESFEKKMSYDSKWENVFAYNDLAETTHDQIIALFDRAIAKVEGANV